MGCLECGDSDFQKFPFTQWVCDKCTEKFMKPFNQLVEKTAKELNMSIEEAEKWIIAELKYETKFRK